MTSRSTALNLYWRPGQSKLHQNSLDAPTYAIFNHRTPAIATSSSSSASSDESENDDSEKHTVIDHSKQARVSPHSKPWSNQGNKSNYNAKSFNRASGGLQSKFAAIADRVESIQPNPADPDPGSNQTTSIQNVGHSRLQPGTSRTTACDQSGNWRPQNIASRLAAVGKKVQAIPQKTNSGSPSQPKTPTNPSPLNPGLNRLPVRAGLNQPSPTVPTKPTLQARALLRPPVRSASKTPSVPRAFAIRRSRQPSSSDDSSDEDQPQKPRPKQGIQRSLKSRNLFTSSEMLRISLETYFSSPEYTFLFINFE